MVWTEQDQLLVAFSVELFGYFVAIVLGLVALWRNWMHSPSESSVITEKQETKHKHMGACHSHKEIIHHFRYTKSILAFVTGATIMMLVLIYFVAKTWNTSSAVTDAMFDEIAYLRFFAGAFALGFLLFGVAKFLFYNDSMTWIMVVAGFVSYYLLSQATFFSLADVTTRWVGFGEAAAIMAIASITLIFGCWFGDVYQENISAEAVEADALRSIRRFIQMWVWFFLSAVFIMWVLGKFGVGTLSISNNVFEQSVYCGIFILLFVFPGVIVAYNMIPMVYNNRVVRTIRSSGNDMVDRAKVTARQQHNKGFGYLKSQDNQ
jgi:hypothetical protein